MSWAGCSQIGGVIIVQINEGLGSSFLGRNNLERLRVAFTDVTNFILFSHAS